VLANTALAAASDHLFTVTVVLYTLAAVAFCAQLAFGRRGAVPARTRALAGVGAGAAADHALLDATEVDAGDTGPGAAPGRTRVPGRRWGTVAMGLTFAGLATHVAVLVTRGVAAHRLPWGNMYEFATAVVLVAVVVYTAFAVRSPGLRHMGVFVLAPVALAMVLTGLFLYTDDGPLVAALRSYWLGIHVTTAIIGFGIFFVSGITSVLYLVRSRYESRVAAGTVVEGTETAPTGLGIVQRLPAAAALDRVAHRTVVFGFPIWTFAVMAGAIWAESAWGRFWGWDPKETWAFIAWVVYAAYLHARTTAGWRGRGAAWINVVGLVVMVFNLLYVNFVSTGLHSYAGVGQ
jgi:cytochrome c-type biogenesis protein CcsB